MHPNRRGRNSRQNLGTDDALDAAAEQAKASAEGRAALALTVR
jgi:hypothetical protein